MKNKKLIIRYIGVNAVIFTVLISGLLILIGIVLLKAGTGAISRNAGIFITIALELIIGGFVVLRAFRIGKSMIQTPSIYYKMSNWKMLHYIIGYAFVNVATTLIFIRLVIALTG